MSEVLGQKGFEGPSEEELEDYIKHCRKSLSQMERGKPPLIFKPKNNRVKIVFSIVFLVVISSGLLSILSLISTNTENNNGNNNHQPEYDEKDIVLLLQDLESIINEMISENHSTINPVMIDGSINTSRSISSEELFDLIWYLHQFESGSEWWDLGKELLFDKFPYWNESTIDIEEYSIQIKALRSFLVYTPEEIPLDSFNLEIFQNSCRLLWGKIQTGFDNFTNTLSSLPNDSLRLASDHIYFIQLLTKVASFPELLNLSTIRYYGKNVLETLDQLTNITNGIPETFDANLTWISHIYHCKHHGELILALDQFDEALDVGFSASPLITRLDIFIRNFLEQEGSCNSTYDFLNQVKSDEILAGDQSLIIRCNVIFEYLQYSKNVALELIKKFKAPTIGFYSSSTDQNNQYLLDQIQILLAFQELIQLEKAVSVITYPSAASSWGLGVFLLMMVILVPLKRKRLKKKFNPK